jgi:redox-sensitive bicupin YhaK (pirin superfamily)
VPHPLGNERHGWLQLIKGDLAVNGMHLHAGDAAALRDEGTLTLSAAQPSEFLFFDLN